MKSSPFTDFRGLRAIARFPAARPLPCFPLLFFLLLLFGHVPLDARAQMPVRGPAPFAATVGNAWILPGGNLALKDADDGRYATAGTAFVQRLMWAPGRIWGLILQAAFPTFGVDAEAVQADYGSSPPIVDGANTISSWSLGLRLRGGRSWRRGPYAEAALERNRASLEVRQEGESADSITFDWETGWMVGAGWVLPVGPTFSIDGALALHRYTEDYFITRWTAFRIMAVFTFGGSR